VAEGGALRFGVVGAGEVPSANVEATCTVSGAGVTVGDFRDSAAATMASTMFPAPTLTFTPSNYMTSQDCVFYSYDDAAMEASETFTVTLTVSGGGAMVGAGMGTATGTIQASDVPATFTIGGAPSVAEGGALRFGVVGAGEVPSGDVEATCTVSGAGVTVGDFRDSAAATMASTMFPAPTLTFTPSNYMTSQDCVFYSYDDADEEASETFTVTLTVSGGGAVVGGTGTATGTIQASDQPAGPQAEERMVRMEQAATALNRATAALSLPVIARRLDPGRGLASPGLALNLDGRQVLSSSSGAGAASASGGASGAPAIGLPQGLGGAASTPSTASTTSTASTMSTPSTATAATATGGPSQPGASSLNLSALAQLAAAQLQGLDSGASGAENRSLRQLLGRSGFSATSEQGGGSTLSLWGRGNYTSLEGEPREGGTTYDYDGDSYGFYLGLDGRYGDYLAGVALGYTTGDVSLHAVSGPAVGAAGDRSDFESDLVTVYPYAAWQPSDRLSVWLLAGYGQGELEIEERRAGMPTLKASSDTDLLLGAAGLSWRRPADNNVDVLLRLSGTALHGETDGGRFDDADGTAYAKTKTDAQQLRGEAELGQVLDFDDGARLRPYLAVGASYDFGDGARDTMTGEFGTGFQLHWPRLGLETEWEVQARLASKSKRSYREYTGTGMLRYDLGGDRRGLQLALRPSLGLARDGLGASGASGVALDGGAFGGAGLPGAVGGGAVPGKGLGLRSELAYGIGGARLARGLPGLLTLYGESGLVSGASSYGGGLRFEAERLLLDAGLQRDSGADSDSAFLLDATLRF
ncbi:MAG: autotransporter outer membrane beta-barrel domain-containing protein, partial [Gammaproteobacteria bacterium]|nr:autotransporter outer membrane beta-barrel domain-containing protein [Gammaproteobacteria bacterium]